MSRKIKALVFAAAMFLMPFAALADAGMECREGHWFWYEERDRWYCNPGGDSCLYCWDEIVVKG